jgi:hypothetical protein
MATLVLAIWGAVLGTIGTIVSVTLAVKEMRKDKLQIKISCSLTDVPRYVSTFKEQERTEPREKQITISVLNIGFRPVLINNVGLALSDGVIVSNEIASNLNILPIKLLESDTLDIHFYLSGLGKIISVEDAKALKVIVQEASGNMYQSKLPKSIKAFVVDSKKPG